MLVPFFSPVLESGPPQRLPRRSLRCLPWCPFPRCPGFILVHPRPSRIIVP